MAYWLDQFHIFLLVLLRVSALLMAAPVFGHRNFLGRAKIGLAFMVSLIIFPQVADQDIQVPEALFPYVFMMVREVLMGLILGFAVTCVTYPLVGLAPISAVDLVVVAGLASFGGPFAALFLAVLAENKITGLALTKVWQGIGMIPLLAYFVGSDWQLLAGIVPTYWSMKVVWLAAAGEPYAWHAVVGLGVNLAVLWLALRRFSTILHR